MRVFLTKPDLDTEAGQQLLDLTTHLAMDGELTLGEIKELGRWLRARRSNTSIAAIPYLNDIFDRITADNLIDRDELLELHLAIERVIPRASRGPLVEARKARQAERKEQRRRREKEQQKAERKLQKEEDFARSMRIRHSFSKVAGVTFPNEDDTERQAILKLCTPGEDLILQNDAYQEDGVFATKILRMDGQQLGHATEYLAEKIASQLEDGYNVVGTLTEVTGGTADKPTLGANFVVFFVAKDVSKDDLEKYKTEILASRATSG